MWLEQNEIDKNLSLTDREKSHPNSTRLRQNKTKGMLNEMRL